VLLRGLGTVFEVGRLALTRPRLAGLAAVKLQTREVVLDLLGDLWGNATMETNATLDQTGKMNSRPMRREAGFVPLRRRRD
jgi:hypothetical protein